MGLFDFLKTSGRKAVKRDVLALGTQGQGAYGQGNTLTEEGLGGLRSLDTTYQQRLNDPLGDVGRGIFTRSRGALADDAVRAQRSNQARVFQLATQSGGTLSPEAQAELQTRNQRGINESLFAGENDLANKEATMTLSETAKLFDRMENIRGTILNTGQSEKMRGLQAILASLGMRQQTSLARMQALSSFANTLAGSAASGAAGGGGGAPGGNVWGVH